MAASTSDVAKKTGASTVTTLAAPGKAIAATSITVGSTTNYPTDTGIVIAIRVVDSSGELVAGTYTEFSATVTSGTTLAIVATPVYGPDQVYAAGSTTQVYIPLSSYAHNKLIDGFIAEHSQLDGTHTDITADSITLGGISHEKTMINGPQGFLINGKISRTVASNNITVAIKTLAGTDPSATDPVYVRIGDNMRSITAALSVTKNAGTNWFGSGGTPFATQEIDYFVYLGYNATDGTVIGFARVPYGLTYSDFSTTSTAETYCAINTITNASATDQYEVVGRFNAILSATASFNWSVPGTSVVISRPIFNTRQLLYTPTPTNYAPGTTGGVNTGRYTIDKNFVTLGHRFTYGSAGSPSVGTAPTLSAPLAGYTSSSAQETYWGVGSLRNGATASYNTHLPRIDCVSTPTVVSFDRATGTNSQISATFPFTWANGDNWGINITYPIK